jgi:hypothetical protein
MEKAVELHTFITLDVDEGHRLDSHPCHFTPREIAPVYIGPKRMSLYVLSLRPQLSACVQINVFQPKYKRDVYNIGFVTVCRDKRWPC